MEEPMGNEPRSSEEAFETPTVQDSGPRLEQESSSDGTAIHFDVSSAAGTRKKALQAGITAKILGGLASVLGTLQILFVEDSVGKTAGGFLALFGFATIFSARRIRQGSMPSALWLMFVGVVGISMELVATNDLRRNGDGVGLIATSLVLVIPFLLLVRGGGAVLRRRLWVRPEGQPEVFNPFKMPKGSVPDQLRAFRRKHPRRSGIVLALMVLGLVLITTLALLVGPGAGLLVGLLGGSLARRLFRKARIVSAPTADELKTRDARPPVVYLRSFADDDAIVRTHWSHRRSVIENWTLWHDRFEEVVVRQLADYGPVIAIGEPGETVPDLGSARAYLSDGWQSTIDKWIDEASIIAVVVGRTEGLAWEVQTITEHHSLGKTVLLFPPSDDQELHDRWKTIWVLLHRGGYNAPSELPVNPTLVALPLPGATAFYLGAKRNAWHYEVALEAAAERLGLKSGA
jgi:hypothetical protein